MYKPVVIIGAPRSGTNMLRDTLTVMPGVGSWPCDEINYIWRHGNLHHPSDEFKPEMATDRIRRYIRGRFDDLAKKGPFEFVVEKTCANCLRVGYVDRVLPEAIYIYIVRDGLDVVPSAIQRWHASLDLRYVLAKARFVPWQDVPYYASRYLGNHVHRLFSREKRLAFWGPKMDSMDEILSRYSIDEVCALQWKACIEASDEFFSRHAQNRVIRVSYESFVREPRVELERICGFTGIRFDAEAASNQLKGISAGSIGKGRRQFNQVSIERLTRLIGTTLHGYGYI